MYHILTGKKQLLYPLLISTCILFVYRKQKAFFQEVPSQYLANSISATRDLQPSLMAAQSSIQASQGSQITEINPNFFAGILKTAVSPSHELITSLYQEQQNQTLMEYQMNFDQKHAFVWQSSYKKKVLAHLWSHLKIGLKKASLQIKSMSGCAAYLSFFLRIDQAGQILDLKIIDSSGQPIFDNFFLEQVRLSQPFPKIPAYLKQETFILTD